MANNTNIKFNLPFTLGLPDAPPTDIEPKVHGVLELVYNAFLNLQVALHQYLGLGQQLQGLWSTLRYDQTLHQFSPARYYAQASETVVYGAAINIFDAGGGIMKFRNANATNNTKPCHGFCTTSGGIALDSYGESILCNGLLTGIAGLTRGSRYFLSTTNGLITAVAPVAAGNIEQALGLAIDTTALLFMTDFDFLQH